VWKKLKVKIKLTIMNKIFSQIKSILGFRVENDSLSNAHDRDLIVVDVGCRWGFADRFLNQLDVFRLYGFDPDKDECERLSRLYPRDRVTLVPLGLADREGVAKLYLTKEPACSSMYEPDFQLTKNCPELECAQKTNEVEMDISTLDLWASEVGLEYVDHIKIDTQGSELLVLNGAEKLLDKIRTLEVEVEFNPIYQGQPLFADVDHFLRKRGFVLWKLTNLAHYGREGESVIELGEDRVHYDHNSQVINKCGGQLYWADAHYVRAEIAQSSFTTRDQLMRDIILLERLNHMDLVARLKNTLGTNL